MKKFDDFLKQSLQDYPIEYNEKHWEKIELELDKKKKSSKIPYYIGAVVLVTIVAGVLLFGENDQIINTVINKVNNTPSKQEKLLEVESTPTPSTNTTKKSEKLENTQQTETIETIAPIEQGVINTSSNVNNGLIEKKPEVKPNTALAFSIKANKLQGCANEGVTFKSDITIPANYLWTFGDGSKSNLPTPTHYYKQAGKYFVTLKVTSLIDGSTAVSQEAIALTINPQPTARLNYKVDNSDNFEQVVSLQSLSKNAIYTEWLIDGKTYRSEELSVKLNKKGNYPTKLIVKNDLGCYDTLAQMVSVERDYNLLAPNAFTPDGDGQNDDFIPRALESSTLNFKMEIIEAKSGKVVFTSNNRSKPWDGTNMQTGKLAENGSYLWIVTLNRGDNTKEVFKGNVTLLR